MNKLNGITDSRKGPIYIFTIISLLGFFLGLIQIILLESLNLPTYYAILLDYFLLVLIMFPALYFLLYKPLAKAIRRNNQMMLNSDASHNMLLTVLDSLDAIIYVADIETYELIFLNKFARNIFGDATGKVCWQTLQKNQSGPCDFCTNKNLVADNGTAKGMYAWEFQNTVDGRWYDIRDRAIRWVDGRIVRLEIATDVTLKKTTEKEKEKMIAELQKALDEINTLRGILPICSFCKKVRDDKGFWNDVEVYVKEHSLADFSHGLCPDCAQKHYPEVFAAD